ncbi:hypothetical protein HK098_007303 [Nowakowskiella sp. JEL0407]|nr:hypothetical protein HK098_007303 [Nowakowskiella sp. JEL0407]
MNENTRPDIPPNSETDSLSPTPILGTSWTINQLREKNLLVQTPKNRPSSYRKSEKNYKWLFDAKTKKRTKVTYTNPNEIKYLTTSHVWSRKANWSPQTYYNDPLIHWNVTACSVESMNTVLNHVLELGYQYVFIDVLCIPLHFGSDSDEKIAELGRMQEYYAEADACLVYMNGFDNILPYKTVSTTISDWFKRVWILQETVFSKQLLFAVRDDNLGEIRFVTKSDMFWVTVNVAAGCGWSFEAFAAVSVLADMWVPNIPNLNQQLYFRNATFQKDRVYGIVSMLDYYFRALDSERFMQFSKSSQRDSVELLFDEISGAQLGVLPFFTTLRTEHRPDRKSWLSINRKFQQLVSVSHNAYYVPVHRHKNDANCLVYPRSTTLSSKDFASLKQKPWRMDTKRELMMEIGQRYSTYGAVQVHSDLNELKRVLETANFSKEAEFEDYEGYVEIESFEPQETVGVWLVPMVLDHRGIWGSGEILIVELVCRMLDEKDNSEEYHLRGVGMRISVKNDSHEVGLYAEYLQVYDEVDSLVY